MTKEIIVVWRKNRWGKPGELQVESKNSADRQGMMGNPYWPDAHGPFGHWVIKKGAFDHLGSIAVKPVYVVIVPKTLVSKECLGEESGQ